MRTATTIHAMRLSDDEDCGVGTRDLFHSSWCPTPNFWRTNARSHFTAGQHPALMPKRRRKRSTRRYDGTAFDPSVCRHIVSYTVFCIPANHLRRTRDLNTSVAAEQVDRFPVKRRRRRGRDDRMRQVGDSLPTIARVVAI